LEGIEPLEQSDVVGWSFWLARCSSSHFSGGHVGCQIGGQISGQSNAFAWLATGDDDAGGPE
jgi:hypothetical protein